LAVLISAEPIVFAESSALLVVCAARQRHLPSSLNKTTRLQIERRSSINLPYSMSYTQYQQYGGNPYDNAPEAEAGQVDGVSYSFFEAGDPGSDL
jgi:hypothetical protein